MIFVFVYSYEYVRGIVFFEKKNFFLNYFIIKNF